MVEVGSLIAYPDRVGSATKTMNVICDLADQFGITLWLDAVPYGSNREHIPLKKLRSFYAKLGFTPVKQVNRRWTCGYHKFNHSPLENVMIRFVEPVNTHPVATAL